ncbi:MAG: hypothetical protein ABW127_00140 [Candidatus Thiodiazotropha endolucinida]
MKIVIQCAAKKGPDAGCITDRTGKQVLFVADPDAAPPSEECIYARPDDIAETGKSWRDLLLEYNEQPENNPLDLYPAYQLYMNDTYRALVNKYRAENVYILSAGWGLIGAEFLTPKYDITFSPSADSYKRRRKRDSYKDFRMLPDGCNDDLVFFGGKDYLPLFSKLSSNYAGQKFVFYNSATLPDAPGCKLIKYHTSTRTNWHYECAKAFIHGAVTT